jgi:hypothetical protein
MSVLDKADKYIGHPREVDEGYEVSMRRTAYAQGYQDAIDKAVEWVIDHIDIPYEGQFVDGCPLVMEYLEYATKRLEYAQAVADALKQAMAEE